MLKDKLSLRPQVKEINRQTWSCLRKTFYSVGSVVEWPGGGAAVHKIQFNSFKCTQTEKVARLPQVEAYWGFKCVAQETNM